MVFAAGESPPDLTRLLDAATLASARVICADGGLSNCLGAGFVPDCVIGDFDSIDVRHLDQAALRTVQRIAHPKRKNASDLELALEHLASESPVPDVVVVVGVSGGRSDHHLFNWLLPMIGSWPFNLRLIDRTVDAHLITGERPCKIPCRVGDTVSLLPLGDVQGVSTDGLEYSLANEDLMAGRTLGLSNVATTSQPCIEVCRGQLLAMRVLDQVP